MKKNLLVMLCLFGIMIFGVQNSFATFIAYEIRQSTLGNSPAIISNSGGTTEFIINEGSMKAALGSDDINGFTIGDITNLSITRHDDTTRFSAGSGPAVAPYFNLWVTDGLGNYAVVANEPSNPAFYSLFTDNGDGTKTYNLDFSNLADKTAKVYETPGWDTNSSWVHTMFGSDPLTFSDLAVLEIAAPNAAYILDGTNGVGGGAPDELGTNRAYGVNWVFGDTLSNYVSDPVGYIVSNATVSASAPVPEPTTMILFGLGLLGVAGVSRRKQA